MNQAEATALLNVVADLGRIAHLRRTTQADSLALDAWEAACHHELEKLAKPSKPRKPRKPKSPPLQPADRTSLATPTSDQRSAALIV